MKKPVVGLATEEDKKNYEEIMVETGAIRNRKNPRKPAADRGNKWETSRKHWCSERNCEHL